MVLLASEDILGTGQLQWISSENRRGCRVQSRLQPVCLIEKRRTRDGVGRRHRAGDTHLDAHKGDFTRLAFSPDSKRIASASSDKTLKLWDAETGREILDFKEQLWGLKVLAFSPDGNRIVCLYGGGVVKIWDAVTGQELQALNGRYLTTVAFSADGKTIALAGGDGNTSHVIDVYNAATGQPVPARSPAIRAPSTASRSAASADAWYQPIRQGR